MQGMLPVFEICEYDDLISAMEAIQQRKEMKDMSVNQLIEAATSMSHVPLLTHGK